MERGRDEMDWIKQGIEITSQKEAKWRGKEEKKGT